jgi:hypothetical protein
MIAAYRVVGDATAAGVSRRRDPGERLNIKEPCIGFKKGSALSASHQSKGMVTFIPSGTCATHERRVNIPSGWFSLKRMSRAGS